MGDYLKRTSPRRDVCFESSEEMKSEICGGRLVVGLENLSTCSFVSSCLLCQRFRQVVGQVSVRITFFGGGGGQEEKKGGEKKVIFIE